VCHKTPLNQFAQASPVRKAESMMSIVRSLLQEDQGQDIAEYAVMLAVILVIVVGTIRLVGNNANNVFSSVGSSVQ
jgi:Flp pilus assembly pilin Flp